jgi:ATPase subunit of ABC transporter with duplicated ATPase domains
MEKGEKNYTKGSFIPKNYFRRRSNLDLETQEHVIQVLKFYPGTLIVISHDENFLKAIGVTESYEIKSSKLERVSGQPY